MTQEPRYIIIRDVSVTTPGDERSRTHPGHGYPEHTDYYQKVEWFHDKEEWEERMRHYTLNRTSFKGGTFEKVTIALKVQFGGATR